MKTRLDETNHMRKLMGLSLLIEQQITTSTKVIYPKIQTVDKNINYRVDVVHQAKGDKPMVLKLSMDKNKAADKLKVSSGLYKVGDQNNFNTSTSFMEQWYPVFYEIIQDYVTKSKKHKFIESEDGGWKTKHEDANGGEWETTIIPAAGYESKQDPENFYFSFNTKQLTKGSGENITPDEETKDTTTEDKFDLKMFCQNNSGVYKDAGSSRFCAWMLKGQQTVVTGINLGGSQSGGTEKGRKAIRQGIWGFEENVLPEVKNAVKELRGFTKDIDLTVHKFKFRDKKEGVIDVLVGVSKIY